MSNDLKKRLRDTPNWMREGFQDWKDNVRTYDRAPFEAADRIEELEAKLEKALEALEFYADRDYVGYDVSLADYGLSIIVGEIIKDSGDKASTTLAELTGGKDE